MSETTNKQPWKYQITNSQRVEEKDLKAAAKKFKRYADDIDMKPDELFVQLVKTLPSSN